MSKKKMILCAAGVVIGVLGIGLANATMYWITATKE
jgi:hypothetical protein